MILPPPPVIRRGGGKSSLTQTLTSSVITDFFSPKPKRRRMDRCDYKAWSDEENFLSCTQEYMDKSVAQGGVVEEEDGMEDSSWFEEMTESYVGLRSEGDQAEKTGAKESSTGGGGGVQSKDDQAENKDDLGGSRNDQGELMDSKVSWTHENSCHPRVIERRDDDSTQGGSQVPDQGQEEEFDSPVSPGPIDPGETTAGQSSMRVPNQLVRDGPFVVEERVELEMEEYGDRDGLDTRMDTLQGGVQAQFAIRTDAGGKDEEQGG